jgi:hypothetical protein
LSQVREDFVIDYATHGRTGGSVLNGKLFLRDSTLDIAGTNLENYLIREALASAPHIASGAAGNQISLIIVESIIIQVVDTQAVST